MMATRITILLAVLAFAGSAAAQTNTQRCQALGQEVQAEFQKSVQARVPKTDPTSFNQDGYDIKGIMSQDVTAGLGKLLSLDFSSIINSVVNKGLDQAAQRASSNFSSRMNGVLNGVGIGNMSFQTAVPGASLNTTPNFAGAANTFKGVTPPTQGQPGTNGVKRPAGPYSR